MFVCVCVCVCVYVSMYVYIYIYIYAYISYVIYNNIISGTCEPEGRDKLLVHEALSY